MCMVPYYKLVSVVSILYRVCSKSGTPCESFLNYVYYSTLLLLYVVWVDQKLQQCYICYTAQLRLPHPLKGHVGLSIISKSINFKSLNWLMNVLTVIKSRYCTSDRQCINKFLIAPACLRSAARYIALGYGLKTNKAFCFASSFVGPSTVPLMLYHVYSTPNHAITITYTML